MFCGGTGLESLSCNMLTWNCPLPTTLRALSVSVDEDVGYPTGEQEHMCLALEGLPFLERFDLVVSYGLLVQPMLHALRGCHLTQLSMTSHASRMDPLEACVLPATLKQVQSSYY